jgi:nucleoside 2-deoxyribosyltransferase
MKIYFALSIRAGREHEHFYAEIAELLRSHGEVLNDHISKKDPEALERQQGLTDVAIYQRDMSMINEADALVADVTIPSTGVGYEVASAEMLGKKVLCLYYQKSEKRLSGMISGNENIVIKIYNNVEDLKKILAEFFK